MPEDATGRQFGVLHVVGQDRVGILQAAATFVSQRGGSIEEGISHTLASEAVVLLYVSGTPEQMRLVESDTSHLAEILQLQTIFTVIRDPDLARDRAALPLTLRVTSPDFAGLLEVLTGFFTRHGLSIVAHHTVKSVLPHSQGAVTYRHKFTVLLPSEFNRKRFIAELDELAVTADFIRDDISHSDFY